jgi:electron transfer flavoprotein alpha subunit
MAILVIAEHDNQSLKAATLNTLGAAQQLSAKGAGDIVVLVAGSGCGAVAEAAAKIAGVAKILVADDAGLDRRHHGCRSGFQPYPGARHDLRKERSAARGRAA